MVQPRRREKLQHLALAVSERHCVQSTHTERYTQAPVETPSPVPVNNLCPVSTHSKPKPLCSRRPETPGVNYPTRQVAALSQVPDRDEWQPPFSPSFSPQCPLVMLSQSLTLLDPCVPPVGQESFSHSRKTRGVLIEFIPDHAVLFVTGQRQTVCALVSLTTATHKPPTHKKSLTN